MLHGTFKKLWIVIMFLKVPIFQFFFLHFFPGGVQVLSATVPSEEERKEWWQAFYRGAAYPTLARVLLHGNVIASYLYCLVLIS